MEDCVLGGDLKKLKEMIDDLGIDSSQRFDLINIAIHNCHPSIAEFLIESDPEEDSCTQHIRPGVKTPLHWACKRHCGDAVASLLQNGAQVDVRDVKGRTPLHCCTDIEVARLLLNHGASIDVRDEDGLTPLVRMLCNERNVASIRRCLALLNELGVKPDQSEQHNLLVKFVSKAYDDDALSELFMHGIDPQARSSSGQTILHRVGADEVRHLRRFGVNVNALDNEGRSLLHSLLLSYHDDIEDILDNWSFEYYEAGVAEGKCDELRILLECNPDMDVNLKDRNSDTPLHVAIGTRQGEFVKLLLNHGADPNISDGSYRSSLILAAQSSYFRSYVYHYGEEPVFTSLLDHGADIFFMMPSGNTVFDYANEKRQKIIIDYILTKPDRSPMDKVDKDGNTVLHYICRSCRVVDIDRLPLDILDLNIANNAGETPLLVASKAGRTTTVALLLRKGADRLIAGRTHDGLTPLHIACVQEYTNESEFANTVASYLEQGLDIDARDRLGKTPLHYAIEAKSTFRVRQLLYKGAGADAADHIGKSALYRAIESDELDIIELILQSSANGTSRFFDGKTPMHMAVDTCNRGTLRTYLGMCEECQLVRLLLEHGLDIDQLDVNGKTPLFYALSSRSYAHCMHIFESGVNLDQLYWIDWERALSLVVDFSYESRLLTIRLREARLLTRDDTGDDEDGSNFYCDWSEYKKRCEHEVACLLEGCKIFGQMTYYDFLHNDDPMIAKAICAGNFDVDRLPVDFPIYGNLIKGKIKMDLFRNELVGSATDKLHSCLIESPLSRRFSIPREIARRILIHLSKNDLIEFVKT